ncbi:MAG: hypothetical protein VKN60_02655 [Cyanobacteriota bacterium]|nr:hypothetical protein [Cyanobacteriota bacterium]
MAKIQNCLQEGAQLAWLIDPSEEIVLVFDPDHPLLIGSGDDILPTLSELSLTLSPQEIFSWLQTEIT